MQLFAMDLGMILCHANQIVNDRPLRFGRKALQEGAVALAIGDYLSDLAETLITFPQTMGKVENVIIDHDVGDHMSAI